MTHEEIMENIRQQAAEFEEAVDAMDYRKARYIYNVVMCGVVRLLKLEEADLILIFGNQFCKEPEDEYIDGYFKREKVNECLHAYSGLFGDREPFEYMIEYLITETKK